MARSDKRFMVYPSPKAIEILGGSSPTLNQALECWAGQLARAIGDNAKKFTRDCEEDIGGKLHIEPLHEWAILAESLKEKRFDPDFPAPGQIILSAVEDAQRFEDVCSKHGRSPFDYGIDDEESAQKTWDRTLDRFYEKLKKLDYVHAWAVINTVDWFWEQSDRVDLIKDSWWHLSFRLKMERNKSKKGKKKEDQKSPKVL